MNKRATDATGVKLPAIDLIILSPIVVADGPLCIPDVDGRYLAGIEPAFAKGVVSEPSFRRSLSQRRARANTGSSWPPAPKRIFKSCRRHRAAR
jgi:hypothetical protein